MDNRGKVLDTKICRTVIRSNRRFTYEEAQDIIEIGKGDYAEEILTLDRLAKILRKERYENKIDGVVALIMALGIATSGEGEVNPFADIVESKAPCFFEW